MDNFNRTNHRQIQKAIFGFAVAFALVVVAAFVTTIRGVDTSVASNYDVAPGTTGLAHPHAPLDRAPGEPVIDRR
jgi:hypothetical protein